MAKKRIRRFVTPKQLKWVGMIVVVLLSSVWIGSMFATYLHPLSSVDRAKIVGIADGRIFAASLVEGFPSDIWGMLGVTEGFLPGSDDGALLYRAIGEITGGGSWRVAVPLWLPLLLIAAPTAWLWYTDRRARPWQCAKCRYDLRGIDTNQCPECGTAVATNTTDSTNATEH